jgi:hypothetical protein
MENRRPNVFPTQKNDIPNTVEVEKVEKKIVTDEEYEAKKIEVANEVYTNSMTESGMNAVEAMRKRTEEQIRLRDAALKKNIDQTNSYQAQFNDANNKKNNQTELKKTTLKTDIKSPINTLNIPNLNMNTIDPYIQQLSQPQFNTAFDVIPLPSEGKLYKNKKSGVKVAYMTTADENILTSPNLLQSGEFLEILINRKLLEPDLRYRDLHIGDRNAIMLWLRATSYGEMYPVTIFDKDGEPFETEFDLNTLKTKKLGAEPDAEGLFDFFLPISKKNIKFRLLTVGDAEDIDKIIEEEKKNNIPVNNTTTYVLERQLVEVNGDRSLGTIKNFAQNMRIGDASKLRDYIESIESGVDLNIELMTPRGESIKTFLPLNVRFFWPKLSV